MADFPERDILADDADQLLLATARGDHLAFERLYKATSPRLYAVCLRVLTQRSEAEDVLQEVYTNVWRKAVQFDPGKAGALTWLSMLARNRAIDRLRAGRNERQSVPIDLGPELVDDTPGAEQLADAALQAHGLDACLEELEPQRRTLIRTAFFEGCTYEELATRSQTPLGTVKSWIRRSLAKLKACLER